MAACNNLVIARDEATSELHPPAAALRGVQERLAIVVSLRTTKQSLGAAGGCFVARGQGDIFDRYCAPRNDGLVVFVNESSSR